MPTTTRRRKWQFSTREAAESAAREIGLQRDMLQVAFQAAMDGSIQKLPGRYRYDIGAYYTFGIIRRYSGNLIVVTFHCPSTGQRDHSAVHPAEWVTEEIGRHQGVLLTDKSRGYVDGLYELRRVLSDIDKER